MKKNYLILLTLFVSCQTTLEAQITVLPNITIGTQIWQSTNLDVDTYSDGTPIPQVTDPTIWNNLTTGAWCYYNNDSSIGAVYGKIYNWYAAAGIFDSASLNNPALRKNLAPAGWHVPTDAEWTILTDYLGGQTLAGGAMKEIGTTDWIAPNVGATNTSGFSGTPGGCRYDITSNSIYDYKNQYGFYWSSSQANASEGLYRFLFTDSVFTYSCNHNKGFGFSVRVLNNQTLSVGEEATNIHVKVYPNPVSSILIIENSNNINKIIITDLSGKRVLVQEQISNQVNVEKLSRGLYLLHAFSGEDQFTTKFVKE